MLKIPFSLSRPSPLSKCLNYDCRRPEFHQRLGTQNCPISLRKLRKLVIFLFLLFTPRALLGFLSRTPRQCCSARDSHGRGGGRSKRRKGKKGLPPPCREINDSHYKLSDHDWMWLVVGGGGGFLAAAAVASSCCLAFWPATTTQHHQQWVFFSFVDVASFFCFGASAAVFSFPPARPPVQDSDL